MPGNPDLIAVIPARGGSKGIPHKNINSLKGIPLIAYTIKASLQSRFVQRTIVSTEDVRIAEVSISYGAEVIKRPPSLAEDTTPTEPVIRNVLDALAEKENCTPENIMLLQPTSPLRTAEDIDRAYEQYLSESADSLLSACRSHTFIWRKENNRGIPVNYDYRNRPRRQEMEQYRENGAIYIFNMKLFLDNNNRLGGKISLYEMDEDSSIEIDTPFDLLLAEHLLNRNAKSQKTTANPRLQGIIKNIKMLVTDVDGVLTDGGMYYSERGEVMKLFNTKDGMGLERLQKKDVRAAIITKENSKIVLERAKKLRIKDVFIAVEDKLLVVKNLATEYDIKLEEICYIGDDINDINVLKNIGLPVAVRNAVPEVKSLAKYITKLDGGKGAVREICDLIVNTIEGNKLDKEYENS